jgi:hypothetical protein
LRAGRLDAILARPLGEIIADNISSDDDHNYA